MRAIGNEQLIGIAGCESSFRLWVKGDHGTSVGLFQINLPSFPDVTEEEALDPEFSIGWAKEQFKKDPTVWTCYRLLYGSH